MTNPEIAHDANPPFEVCPTCQGFGTHGPGHVFTQDDLDEQFGADQFDVMEDYRAGRYDVVCSECGGKRVTPKPCGCDRCEADRQEIWELEAMERAERAFGC
jgi:hypothetical protein